VVKEFVQEIKDAIVQLMLEDQKMLEDQEADQVQEAEADPDPEVDQVQEKELDAQDADKVVVVDIRFVMDHVIMET
jgi:hypothetical protein